MSKTTQKTAALMTFFFAYCSMVQSSSPPTEISIKMLTPPEKCIVGDTIKIAVGVSNYNSLKACSLSVSIAYQGSSEYGDSLFNPQAIIHNSVFNLNTLPKTKVKIDEFLGSCLDTIKCIFYKATTSDTLQQIYFYLDSLLLSSDPFQLLPADPSSISIRDYKSKNLDSVHLKWPNDILVFYAFGYDRFGNKTAFPNSVTWSVSNTLHPIDSANNAIRIIYNAVQVKSSESGQIYVTTFDAFSKKISDSVHVDITGPLAQLKSAVADDANGNGYLDRIILRFDGEVTLPKNNEAVSMAHITCLNSEREWGFTADSIKAMSNHGLDTDTVFCIYMREMINLIPQTSWTLKIEFHPDLPGAASISDFPCTDGAGPVIWEVTKDAHSSETIKDDEIKVVFSETIESADGSTFKMGRKPSQLFYVWTKDSQGNFTRDNKQNPLESINFFTSMRNTDVTTVTFVMTNGFNITDNHYFSIRTDSCEIMDQSTLMNMPSIENRKMGVNEKNSIMAPVVFHASKIQIAIDRTSIRCFFPERSLVSMDLFDLRGRLVQSIAHRPLEAGTYSFPLPSCLPKGSYVLSLQANKRTINNKILFAH